MKAWKATVATVVATLRLSKARWLVGLFLYGALAHLLALRMVAHWGYRPSVSDDNLAGNPWFVNHPLTNLGVALLGGIFVSLFMRRLLLGALRAKKAGAFRIIGTAGLYGVLATTLVLQVVFVTGAALLLVSGIYKVGLPKGYWLPMLGVFLLSIEVQAFVLILQCIPFGLAYGVPAGAFVLWALRKSQTI